MIKMHGFLGSDFTTPAYLNRGKLLLTVFVDVTRLSL